MELALSFIGLLQKADVASSFVVLFRDGLKEWIDDTMCAAFASMRKAGLGVDTFWIVHSKSLSLLLPDRDVEAILACKTSWLNVAEPLSKVCASCKVGCRMFGWALSMVSADRLSDFAIKKLQSITGTLTKDKESKYIQEVVDEAEKLDIKSALQGRRNINIDYRGLGLTLETQGIAEEATLRWSALVRAIGQGTPRLPLEDELFGKVTNERQLCKESQEQVVQARTMLNQLIEENPSMSFNALCAKKAAVIVQSGPAARIDIAIGTALLAKGGEDMMVLKILECMPSATKSVEPSHCVQQLDRLRSGPLFSAVSKAGQAMLQTVLDAVSAIHGNRPPCMASFEPENMREIQLRMALFFVVKVVEKDKKDKVVAGGPAATIAFDNLCKKNNPKLNDLEEFHVFGWLLSATQRQKIQELTTRALESMTTTRNPLQRAASSHDLAGQQQQQKKQKTEDSGVMALFG